MKRAPLTRKTPLRANRDAMAEWQRRSRKPLPRTGAKARRERTDLDAAREVVSARITCQATGLGACVDYAHFGRHVHHIAPSDRDRGLHDPERMLLLCPLAHNWVHDHPRQAEALGLLERAH